MSTGAADVLCITQIKLYSEHYQLVFSVPYLRAPHAIAKIKMKILKTFS